MSTIQASNVSDGTTTVGTSYVVNGSAKSWCSWDASATTVINDSMNVSSIEDLGTGLTKVNYTNSFASEHYATGACGRAISAGGFAIIRMSANHFADSTRFVCENASDTDFDGQLQTIMNQGDLA